MSDPILEIPAGPRGAFPQTRWSMVLSAQEDDPAALARICESYWYPLYCCARRLKPDPADAEDLTQDFFSHLLSRETLGQARAERGKLRTFLLTCLKNYAGAAWRKSQAARRGGGREQISFDALEAEARYGLEPQDHESPDRLFDRSWAYALLDRVMSRLREAYHASGKGGLFDALKDQLVADGDRSPWQEISARTGITEATLRYAAFKMRRRYREVLLEEIRETVETPAEVEEELHHLKQVFQHHG